MDSLFFLQKHREYALEPDSLGEKISVRLVTNFTDAILARILNGVLAHQGIANEVRSVPYKQYHLDFANTQSDLWQGTQATVIWFEANPYRQSEFHDPNHWAKIKAALQTYAEHQTGPIIVVNFLLPQLGPHGNNVQNDPYYQMMAGYNADIRLLAETYKNIHILDAARLAWRGGGEAVRDRRGLYAFDTPFTNAFLTTVAREIAAYIALTQGKIRKCLVLDLDNTVWGGIVGEVGVTGIQLGPDYPGLAFKEFQRAIAQYADRGLLLAVNSRNNRADVDPVWAEHPHMILKPEHFAAIQINWNNKADNLRAIAQELNIGLDSLIFFDDDAANRALVRQVLPEVLVPEFSVPPEDYIQVLHSLPELNYLQLTEEDKQKAAQYTQERARQAVRQQAGSFADYLAELRITITMNCNNPDQIPRIAQLTGKTNQCNVTTRRYSEADIAGFMATGRVWAAQVADAFGDYGLTVVAITVPEDNACVRLDSFLMSCRVMGRSVEVACLDYLAKFLYSTGAKILKAEFIPTAKNQPAQDLFTQFGFTPMDEQNHWFALDLEQYLAAYPEQRIPAIHIA